MTILNKYKRWNPLLILSKKNIWDFVLTKNNFQKNNSKDNLCSIIDVSNIQCINDNSLCSLGQYTWDESINEGVELKNIGLTAIDSGYIKYRGDKISNDEFFEILSNSVLRINEGDMRLKMNPVNSNNNVYDFSYSFKKEDDKTHLSLKGGFFQGFFKLYGHDYQVLPSRIENYWKINITLRLQDYDVTHNSLNCIHPNNKGIFFYIGTRAENKFLAHYKYDLSNFEKRDVESSRDFICDGIYNGYFIENVNNTTPNNENFSGEYFVDEYLSNKIHELYFADDEYLISERDISNETIVDSDKNSVDIEGYVEIKTDNKFLFFNNTKDGYTTDTWENDIDIVLTDSKHPKTPNLYLLLNNSSDGYTTETLSEYYNNLPPEEPSFKDIINNAFALRIKDDGSIGYRYLVEDCENEYKVIEEYSKPNIIKNGEWVNVCAVLKKISSQTMQVLIYINEKLKFISKEIPMLYLREIDEYKTKQEGVPYNISIGGGTMGLCNSLWINYYDNFDYILPLEKHFAGTFLGDIKSFSFFNKK